MSGFAGTADEPTIACGKHSRVGNPAVHANEDRATVVLDLLDNENAQTSLADLTYDGKSFALTHCSPSLLVYASTRVLV